MTKETVGIKRQTITVSEAAQLLGISRNAAYAAVQRGEIPVIRLGRRLVIPKAQLEEMLAGGDSRAKGADVGFGT